MASTRLRWRANRVLGRALHHPAPLTLPGPTYGPSSVLAARMVRPYIDRRMIATLLLLTAVLKGWDFERK
jgi:hypothetical protein